ncbi:MAG: cohesin domain-containing protein [Bacteroidales bacterium]
MSGNWYRCIVAGYCMPDVASDPAELLVLPRITAIAGTVSDCPGTVTVPIDVTHFINVASFSLTLNFNPAVLSYNNSQSLNPALSGGTFVVNSIDGKVWFAWSSKTPATIGDGLLLELVFTGVTGNSILNWENGLAGSCEFSDLDGNIIFDNYVNGSATVYQPPLITNGPANQTAPEGQAPIFLFRPQVQAWFINGRKVLTMETTGQTCLTVAHIQEQIQQQCKSIRLSNQWMIINTGAGFPVHVRQWYFQMQQY